MSLRLASVTFVFVMMFVLLAIVARAVSLATNRATFDPNLSRDVYAASVMGGTVALGASLALYAQRLMRLDERLHAVARRLNAERGRSTLTQASQVGRGGSAATGVSRTWGPADSASAPPNDLLVLTPSPLDANKVTPRTSDKKSRETDWAGTYERLLRARKQIGVHHLGPASVSLIFIGISAAILPGVGGITTTSFRLNTMLILFLMFGWCLLLVWLVVLSIAFRPNRRRRDSK